MKTGFRSLVKFSSHFNSCCLVYDGSESFATFFNSKSVATHLLLRTRQFRNFDEDRLSAVFRQWKARPSKLRRRIPVGSSVVTRCFHTCFVRKWSAKALDGNYRSTSHCPRSGFKLISCDSKLKVIDGVQIIQMICKWGLGHSSVKFLCYFRLPVNRALESSARVNSAGACIVFVCFLVRVHSQ